MSNLVISVINSYCMKCSIEGIKTERYKVFHMFDMTPELSAKWAKYCSRHTWKATPGCKRKRQCDHSKCYHMP